MKEDEPELTVFDFKKIDTYEFSGNPLINTDSYEESDGYYYYSLKQAEEKPEALYYVKTDILLNTSDTYVVGASQSERSIYIKCKYEDEHNSNGNVTGIINLTKWDDEYDKHLLRYTHSHNAMSDGELMRFEELVDIPISSLSYYYDLNKTVTVSSDNVVSLYFIKFHRNSTGRFYVKNGGRYYVVSFDSNVVVDEELTDMNHLDFEYSPLVDVPGY